MEVVLATVSGLICVEIFVVSVGEVLLADRKELISGVVENKETVIDSLDEVGEID